MLNFNLPSVVLPSYLLSARNSHLHFFPHKHNPYLLGFAVGITFPGKSFLLSLHSWQGQVPFLSVLVGPLAISLLL